MHNNYVIFCNYIRARCVQPCKLLNYEVGHWPLIMINSYDKQFDLKNQTTDLKDEHRDINILS